MPALADVFLSHADADPGADLIGDGGDIVGKPTCIGMSRFADPLM